MTGLRNYALVTATYWAFTLTDGALRMLVLLHFHELGYGPARVRGGDRARLPDSSPAARDHELIESRGRG